MAQESLPQLVGKILDWQIYICVVFRRGRGGAGSGAGLVGGAAGSVVAMTAYVEL